MTVSDGWGGKVAQQKGVLTPWTPVVTGLAVAVLPGGGDVLIAGFKTLRKQLNICIM